MRPIARTEGLITQDLKNETLVYDRADTAARCLNSIAAAVWRLCDGSRTVEEIAVEVAPRISLPEGVSAEAAVVTALAELDEHGLLLVGPDGDSFTATLGSERRELIKALALVPIFPQISRILAPTMNQTASNPTQTPTNTNTSTTTPTSSSTPEASASTSNTRSNSASRSTSTSSSSSATSSGTATATASRSFISGSGGSFRGQQLR